MGGRRRTGRHMYSEENMSRTRRRGLGQEPPGGWPLDEVLVGVGTLRTIRELIRQDRRSGGEAARAWDLALWCGITVPGATKSLERLHGASLVTRVPPDRTWRAAAYRLNTAHPLVPPTTALLEAEAGMVRRRRFPGRASQSGTGPRPNTRGPG